MQRYAGLTWDHPRGYNALAAAAARLDPERDGLAIDWQKQPLEGFESHPIKDLCARYDLVVLDHPHVGEAVEADCLIPLEDVFDSGLIEELEEATIGPCLASYRFAGRHWALPLDAAAQVMAARADLLDAALPVTWDDVLALSGKTGKVALSLAGPHAVLTYFSMATAIGEAPGERDPDLLVSPATGKAVFEHMRELAARSPRSVRDRNPIGILAHMAESDDVALCPLIYGYVNYAAPAGGHTIRFVDAPRMSPGGRPGSTLGGTGIGISRRCRVTPGLKRHLQWLLSEPAQHAFIPAHDGQPSRRSVWKDDGVNRHWGDFYNNTSATLEAAYLRPRHAGYIDFQSTASTYLREALEHGEKAALAVEVIQELYEKSRPVKSGER